MVNVIIPVYKSKRTIEDTLRSLLSQTKKMFFITIVQDCDNEDYSEIINRYRNLGLHISLLKTPENLGPGGARQLGFDNNKMCDYVIFLDSDDMLNPRAIEILYREAKRNDADVLASSFILESSYDIGRVMDPSKIPATWVHGKIYKVDYLKKNNIRFIKELRLNEDSYFNLVACNSTKKFYKIKEVTHIWRDNKNSLTRFQDDNIFFLKSYLDYIKSQILGLQKIYEITNNLSNGLIGKTLINIYDTIMRKEILNGTDDSYKEYLSILNNDIFQSFFDNKNNWFNLIKELKTGIIIKNEYYFYKINFEEWYKRDIKGVI